MWEIEKNRHINTPPYTTRETETDRQINTCTYSYTRLEREREIYKNRETDLEGK